VWARNLNADIAHGAGVRLEANGDNEAAEAEYRQAAEEGHTDAAVALGRLVFLRDPGEAIGWWTWAYERGDWIGPCFIGGAYEMAAENGQEGALEEAERYYRLALGSEDADTRSAANNGLWRLPRQIAASAAQARAEPSSGSPHGGSPNASETIRFFAIYDRSSERLPAGIRGAGVAERRGRDGASR
jgi:TPR repeat protein